MSDNSRFTADADDVQWLGHGKLTTVSHLTPEQVAQNAEHTRWKRELADFSKNLFGGKDTTGGATAAADDSALDAPIPDDDSGEDADFDAEPEYTVDELRRQRGQP